VTACFFLFIPINHLTILSSIAIVGGLYFFFVGFHLLARKRLLLATPTSKIHSAALGRVEVNGRANGPYSLSAPITGKPCFLYHTTVWQRRDGKKQEWEKVADETLHLPFFIDESTIRLLIEPLGADLDLHCDFHEEFQPSLFASSLNDVPPRISVFLSRHGIVPTRRLRIEEKTVKRNDALFITGTLTENPGVQVRPFSPHGHSVANDCPAGDVPHNLAPNNYSTGNPAPQVIKLFSGTVPSNTQEMSQQAKIAAALTRAGITRPEAWSVAGVSYQPVGFAENTLSTEVAHRDQARSPNEPLQEGPAKSSDFDLNPPVVLMKGGEDPTFLISFRSQKEFVSALAWKSVSMILGGTAIMVLGVYMLLAQIGLP